MMPCEHVEGWLAAEADGALEGPDRDLLLAHLASCSACRARLAEQRQVAVALAGDVAPRISQTEWSAQWQQIVGSLPTAAVERDAARSPILFAPPSVSGMKVRPAEHRRMIRPTSWRVWAPTAIAASVLLAAAWWMTIGSAPRAMASPVHMALAEDADIEEIDVVGETTRCMIVQTSPDYAAVIWISDESEEDDRT
jgi:anti-sigma factor RsiW